jgi:hypothetical protein
MVPNLTQIKKLIVPLKVSGMRTKDIERFLGINAEEE